VEKMRVIFFKLLGIFLCMMISGCAPFRYKHPISAIKETQGNLVSPEGRNVHPDTIRWLLSIGALQYGLSINEIQSILAANSDNYCGLKVKLAPFEKTSLPELSKIKVHGMPFSGQYFAIEEWNGDSRDIAMLLAFENNKTKFGIIRPTKNPEDLITLYLIDDRQGRDELMAIAAEQSKGSELYKANLARWLIIEDKLYDFLHQKHSKIEINTFFKETLKEGNSGQWVLKESSYKSENDFLGYKFLSCFKRDFAPQAIVALYVSEASFYYCNFFTAHPSSNVKFDESDIILECYFNDDILAGVTMKRNLLRIPLKEGMLFTTRRKGEFNDKGEPLVSLWGLDICIEDKKSHQLYATFPNTVMFWKLK
jgi:hypothetical protein